MQITCIIEQEKPREKKKTTEKLLDTMNMFKILIKIS